MRWLPKFSIGETCMAEREWEAEGPYLQIVWGRFVFEIALCKIDRDFREGSDAR